MGSIVLLIIFLATLESNQRAYCVMAMPEMDEEGEAEDDDGDLRNRDRDSGDGDGEAEIEIDPEEMMEIGKVMMESEMEYTMMPRALCGPQGVGSFIGNIVVITIF